MMTTLTSRGLTIALGLSLVGAALGATTASARPGGRATNRRVVFIRID
jgi:hypothetical protein